MLAPATTAVFYQGRLNVVVNPRGLRLGSERGRRPGVVAVSVEVVHTLSISRASTQL